MPFYEYRCSACGHELEAMQKISDAPLTDCPECAGPHLQKLASASGFQLKGSGWYQTDFKGGQSQSGSGDKSAGDSGGHACGTGSCPACQ